MTKKVYNLRFSCRTETELFMEFASEDGADEIEFVITVSEYEDLLDQIQRFGG